MILIHIHNNFDLSIDCQSTQNLVNTIFKDYEICSKKSLIFYEPHQNRPGASPSIVNYAKPELLVSQKKKDQDPRHPPRQRSL